MLIRPATEADLPAIMEIERTPGFEQFFGRFDEAEHIAQLADPDCRKLVALDSADLVGFALLLGFEHGNGHVRLNRIAVKKPGKGDGQILLDAIKSIAFEPPATARLWLRVAENNSRARHVYERNGFTLEEILTNAGVLVTGQTVNIARYGLLREHWQR
mgnify:CR=1 FL=1